MIALFEPASPNLFKVTLMLKELGICYEHG
jgi:glutathione S-transferase